MPNPHIQVLFMNSPKIGSGCLVLAEKQDIPMNRTENSGIFSSPSLGGAWRVIDGQPDNYLRQNLCAQKWVECNQPNLSVYDVI